MSTIEVLPPESFGYDFVLPPYLPEGGNEYYLRDEHFAGTLPSWRHLTGDEIDILVRNRNNCKNWDDVLVEDPFDITLFQDNLFAGLVRIRSTQAMCLKFHDFTVPTGITHSRIISCDIGESCAIHNCSYISHYCIGNSVIMAWIDEMSCSNHAKFGEGIIKDGEDEAVRVWIDPINEAGGRSVLPFRDMICADAYLWATNRDDTVLMNRLKEITQEQGDTRRGHYGIVGDCCTIKSCRVIKDTFFGPHAYVKGANKLKNLTIKSSEDEKTQIGEGVELVNGIIGYGCHIFYGAMAVRFVLGNNSSLKYGARLIHSILGDNSTISCCEVLNNLVFPGHEQHHNNSFLIATLVMGQSNMAAGATVGSNHNSRGNDGEIFAGRGFWPGLSSTLKHNCRFASFTLLTKGSYPAELDIMFPFSMVLEDHKNNELQVMPAYYWLYNMYALERNSWKYSARDKRKTVVQRIETDYLAPDTVKEMIDALSLLERWVGKAWYLSREGNSSLPEDTVLEEKGRFLITGSPETVAGLFVRGEKMERSKRPVRIMKVVESWKAYRSMLLYYGVKTIAGYLSGYGIHYEYFSAQVPRQISFSWENFGGQLVPEGRAAGLRAGIRSGIFNTWEDIHGQYDVLWNAYPRDRAEHAYGVLRYFTGESEIHTEKWNSLLVEAAGIRRYIEEQVTLTKEKDYQNPYRDLTYRNAAERDAVLGRVEENSFITLVKKETQTFLEMLDKVKV